MNKLQCDICGGSLIMDNSGDFAECESCGMKFKRETIKKMIVELSGTVQVEGIANAENLLARAREFENSGALDKACEYYNRVLDLDLNNEEAKERYAFYTKVIKIGEIVNAKIVRIMPFGAFAVLPNAKEGLIHITRLGTNRVEKVEDVVKVGDIVQVKILEYDTKGRCMLSYAEAF